MWSEDPGKKTPTNTEEPKPKKREAERVSETPLRWFFGFDGWGAGREEDEFVLA